MKHTRIIILLSASLLIFFLGINGNINPVFADETSTEIVSAPPAVEAPPAAEPQPEVSAPPAVEAPPAAEPQPEVSAPPAVEAPPAAEPQPEVSAPPAVEAPPAAEPQQEVSAPPDVESETENSAPQPDDVQPTPDPALTDPTPLSEDVQPTPDPALTDPILLSEDEQPTPDTALTDPTPLSDDVQPTPDPALTDPTPPSEDEQPTPDPDLIDPTLLSEDVQSTPDPALSVALEESGVVPDSPENTLIPDLIILDSDGNQLSPVSLQAEAALLEPDPYFFIGTTKYSFSKTDCGPDHGTCDNPLQAVFDYIAANNLSPLGGAVYADADTYATPSSEWGLIINGDNWNDKSKIPASLSLIGSIAGQDKSTGSSEDHFISGNLFVSNIKSFSLIAFTVDGFTNITNNSGVVNLTDVDTQGLGVDNKGAINLDSVTSNDNDGTIGALIENNIAGSTTPVSIRNSSFNNNDYGIEIRSNGLVTLNGVSASDNDQGYGALIQSAGLSVDQSIFKRNGSVYNENDERMSSGLCYLGIKSASLSVTNSQFNENAGSGFIFSQYGNTIISNVRAASNGHFGLQTHCTIGGEYYITAGDIKISQVVVLDNDAGGFDANIRDGSIQIENSGFMSNTGYGANIANANISSGKPVKPVTITNSSFSNNMGYGVQVFSRGAITVKDVNALGNSNGIADNNNNFGVKLSNNFTGATAGISVLNSAGVENHFNKNLNAGLIIRSNGNVIINAAQADQNGYEIPDDPGTPDNEEKKAGDGIFVDNNLGNKTSVLIDGVSGTTANQNKGSGIRVYSTGLITVKNMDAENNLTGSGFYLHNSYGGSTAGINVLSTLSRWFNGLNSNGADGLNLSSNGSIVIQKTKANDNNRLGGWISNNSPSSSASVTISDSEFNNNLNSIWSDEGWDLYGGLNVYSNGQISLNNVSANNNGYDDSSSTYNDKGIGAYLNNQNATTAKPVSIINSRFDNNYGTGLKILSKGAVTFTNGSINYNSLVAALMDNSGALSNQPVSFTSVSIDGGKQDGNGALSGLIVRSKGDITLNKTQVNNFLGLGTYLNNTYGTGSVSILGEPTWWRSFGNTGGTGLAIWSNGAVTIKYISSYDNTNYGAKIDNSGGTGAVTISDADFSGNVKGATSDPVESGLSIKSRGIISITNVNVNNNGLDAAQTGDSSDTDISGNGAVLDNSSSSSAAAVLISNSKFSDNFGIGLNVLSKGAITFNSGYASRNNLRAVIFDNRNSTTNQPVTIKSVSMYGDRWSGHGDLSGLQVYSKGNIQLSNVGVDNFAGDGILLDNSFGTGSISISGSSQNNIYYNYFGGSGLTLRSNGTVSLQNMSISDNGSYGADILTTGSITITDTEIYNNAGFGAKLDNVGGNGSITIQSTKGIKYIDNNGDYGLWATSKGNITLKNISIHDNDGFGAWLNNSASSSGTVTISSDQWTNWQSNGDSNGEFGLKIESPGTVSITLISVSNSYDTNVAINNTFSAGTATPEVKILLSWFNSSVIGSGLDIASKGNISLSSVDARWNNNGHGADLNNGGVNGKGAVTIIGNSNDDIKYFNDNGTFGLQIISNGSVVVKNIESKWNGSFGAFIDNSSAKTPQSVSLSSTIFDENAQSTEGWGLKVLSKGSITGFEVSAHTNGRFDNDSAYGILLDNCIDDGSGKCTGNGAVKLTSSGAYNNNGDGLTIRSYGEISFSDVGAGWNENNGATIDNAETKANLNPLLADIPSAAGVTISMPANYASSWGFFGNNGGYGLKIDSNGTVLVSNVNVNHNGNSDFAAKIDNTTASSAKAVTIQNSIFNDNQAVSGIKVFSKGTVTVTKIEVNSNQGSYTENRGAVEIDNSSSPFAAANVFVKDSSFQSNKGGNGLLIQTRANATLTNVFSIYHAANGVKVDTSAGTGSVTINGTMNTFTANGNNESAPGNGALLISKGNVTVSNILADHNDGDGLAINADSSGNKIGASDGTGSVTVTNATFNNNNLAGIRAYSNGNMVLSKVTSFGSYFGDGAHLTTNNKDISISNSSFLLNNQYGLWTDTGISNTLKLNKVNTVANANGKNLYYTGKMTKL